MTVIPEPTVQATRYTVSCLPEGDINAHVYAIEVVYRGEGRWAIQQGDHACLGADGTWAQGVKPYDRGDDWLTDHRFDLDTALKLAKEAAPHVVVNGRTVAGLLSWYADIAKADQPTAAEAEADAELDRRLNTIKEKP